MRINRKIFNLFVNEHKVILDRLYLKHIEPLQLPITIQDFYLFAFKHSTIDLKIKDIYLRYSNE
jgi:hypothetical protein